MAELHSSAGAAAIDIREGRIEELHELYDQIPEFAGEWLSEGEPESRLSTPGALLLIATRAGVPVGFKAGYDRYSDGSFYSWLGGVVPEARKLGVAQALLNEQERRVTSAGYDRIYVKSRNRLVPMLTLLLSNGYAVVGVDLPDDLPLADGRVLFAKLLRG